MFPQHSHLSGGFLIIYPFIVSDLTSNPVSGPDFVSYSLSPENKSSRLLRVGDNPRGVHGVGVQTSQSTSAKFLDFLESSDIYIFNIFNILRCFLVGGFPVTWTSSIFSYAHLLFY